LVATLLAGAFLGDADFFLDADRALLAFRFVLTGVPFFAVVLGEDLVRLADALPELDALVAEDSGLLGTSSGSSDA